MKWLSILILVLFSSCRHFPEKVEFFPETLSMDDPRIQPFLRAAASFDRVSHGFTPLPKTADVGLESSRSGKYDAMLHIYAKPSRTMFFRKTNGGYRWIGEQEMLEGPKKFTSPDGTFSEHIVLTYEIEGVFGFPTNRLNVLYEGKDSRLASRWNMTLDDARPILKEWGY
jgi:hypothetical protein